MTTPTPIPDDPDFEADSEAIQELAEQAPNAPAPADVAHRVQWHVTDIAETLEPIREAIDNDYDEMMRNNPDMDPIMAARSDAGESSAQLSMSEDAVEKAERTLSGPAPITNQQAHAIMQSMAEALSQAEEAKPADFKYR